MSAEATEQQDRPRPGPDVQVDAVTRLQAGEALGCIVAGWRVTPADVAARQDHQSSDIATGSHAEDTTQAVTDLLALSRETRALLGADHAQRPADATHAQGRGSAARWVDR